MIIYGKYKTIPGLNANAGTPRLDFIEVEFTQPLPEKYIPEDLDGDGTGMILSIDWDESYWDYDSVTGENSFKCKGVYINQVYANGMLEAIKTAILDTIQVFIPDTTNKDIPFQLLSLEVADGEETWKCPENKLKPRWVDIVD